MDEILGVPGVNKQSVAKKSSLLKASYSIKLLLKSHSKFFPSTENVNFLIADGIKFAHPLHHLGKSKEDLPLIAIDSFRHMYLFPKYEDMHIPGKLKQVSLIFLSQLALVEVGPLFGPFVVGMMLAGEGPS